MITALLWLVWSWMVVWCTVPIRRLLKGPARPGWSLRYEILATLMQRVAMITVSHPLPVVRRLWDGSTRWAPVLRLSVAADCPAVPCTWFGERTAADVVLYLHGGAYVLGSVVAYAEACTRLARAGDCRVLAPDYRLAPEHPHPAALQDALAAYSWLVDVEQIAPDRITVAGDSAGGGLTLALLMALRDAGRTLPARAALISPWADVEGTGASQHSNAPFDYVPDGAERMFGRMYAGRLGTRDPSVSPVHADFSGLPPLLVMVGGAERLLDVGCRVAERAEQAGVQTVLEISEDMIHAWPLFAAIVPQGRQAWRRIGRWVTEGV